MRAAPDVLRRVAAVCAPQHRVVHRLRAKLHRRNAEAPQSFNSRLVDTVRARGNTHRCARPDGRPEIRLLTFGRDGRETAAIKCDLGGKPRLKSRADPLSYFLRRRRYGGGYAPLVAKTQLCGQPSCGIKMGKIRAIRA